MSESGPNQRIEPTVVAAPIHLHDRAGSGVFSRKDPTKAITPNDGTRRPSLLPTPLEEIILPPIPPEVLPPGEEEIPVNPPVEGEFPFILFDGAWYAYVTYDGTDQWIQFASPLPSWFTLSHVTPGEWVVTDLPTADPGGGAVWLSAT